MKFFKSITIFILMMSLALMMLSNNPLMMGFLVITQCVFMSLTTIFMFYISWFSFLIFMIYLGGILMIFSYIISLTFSKEPMMKKNTNFMLISFIFIVSFITTMNKESFIELMKMDMSQLLISMFSKNMKITIFMVYFLLLIMVMVTFISESNKSSMRST